MKKILTILLTSLLLVACTSNTTKTDDTANNKQVSQETNDSETFKVVNEYLANRKQAIIEAFVSSESNTNTDIVKEMVGEYETELSNEVISDDKASVDVTVKTYDMGNLINEYITDSISKALELSMNGEDDKMEDAIKEVLDEKVAQCKANGKTYTKTVTISLSKEDGNWVVEDNSELDDALCGGVNSAMEEINQMISDTTETAE